LKSTLRFCSRRIFVYVANWGTHVLKLRFPSDVLPLKIAKQYCRTRCVFAKEKDKMLIALMRGEGMHAGSQLMARLRQDRRSAGPAGGPPMVPEQHNHLAH